MMVIWKKLPMGSRRLVQVAQQIDAAFSSIRPAIEFLGPGALGPQLLEIDGNALKCGLSLIGTWKVERGSWRG